MRKMRLLILLLCGIAATGRLCAQDDISVRSGAYEIFYSAFNTSFLSPEVASAIGAVRAKNRGMVNISIVRHFADGQQQAVAAKTIEGSTFNLLHRETLDFQEVVETNARYYLATFNINNDNELIVIDVAVRPEGEAKPIELSFKRHFYLNES
jgi:hypothetical protein